MKEYEEMLELLKGNDITINDVEKIYYVYGRQKRKIRKKGF